MEGPEFTALEKEERVLEYLASQRLWRKNGISTLRGKKSALARHFKLKCLDDPTGGFRVKTFLSAVQRKDGKAGEGRKWPVSKRHLLWVKHALGNIASGSKEGIGSMDWVYVGFLFSV